MDPIHGQYHQFSSAAAQIPQTTGLPSQLQHITHQFHEQTKGPHVISNVPYLMQLGDENKDVKSKVECNKLFLINTIPAEQIHPERELLKNQVTSTAPSTSYTSYTTHTSNLPKHKTAFQGLAPLVIPSNAQNTSTIITQAGGIVGSNQILYVPNSVPVTYVNQSPVKMAPISPAAHMSLGHANGVPISPIRIGQVQPTQYHIVTQPAGTPSPKQVRYSPRPESGLYQVHHEQSPGLVQYSQAQPVYCQLHQHIPQQVQPQPQLQPQFHSHPQLHLQSQPQQHLPAQIFTENAYAPHIQNPIEYNPLTKNPMSYDQEREWERLGGIAKYQASYTTPLSPGAYALLDRVAIATATSNVGMIATQALLLQNNFLMTHPDRRKSSMERMKHKISHRKEDDLNWSTINDTFPVKIHAGIFDEAKAPYLKEYHNTSELDIFAGIDADHPDSLDALFRGCSKALVIPSQSSRRVEHTNIMIDVAKRCGVRHVVLLSIIGAQEEPFLFAQQYRDIENHLMFSGLSWTILRCSFFYQDLFVFVSNIQNKTLPLPGGPGRWTPVDMTDVGRAAAVVLSSNGHENKIYNLTGPQSYDGPELAKLIGSKLRSKVLYQEVSTEELKTILMQRGMPMWQAQGMAELLEFYKSTRTDDTSLDLQTLLGGRTDLGTWVQRNRQRFNEDEDLALPALPR